ncbi:MAG: alpha/beta fold hydrolase [Chloroflexi bacterium]|nr:alpha/beta fold hydrolase [Chloroflexota bacterium]
MAARGGLRPRRLLLEASWPRDDRRIQGWLDRWRRRVARRIASCNATTHPIRKDLGWRQRRLLPDGRRAVDRLCVQCVRRRSLLPVAPSAHPTDELAQLGWSVVRYDLRGMGSSSRVASDMDPGALVRDLEAVVDRLGLRSFALAGLHCGAATAIRYAAFHAESVAELVLLNPFASGAQRFGVDPAGRTLASLAGLASDDWAYFTLVAGNLVTNFANPEHARNLAATFQRSTSPKTHQAFLAAMRDVNLAPILPRIQMPTLVVHDTGFPFGSFTDCEEIASVIPHSRLIVIPGDGAAELLPCAQHPADSRCGVSRRGDHIAEPVPLAVPAPLGPRCRQRLGDRALHRVDSNPLGSGRLRARRHQPADGRVSIGECEGLQPRSETRGLLRVIFGIERGQPGPTGGVQQRLVSRDEAPRGDAAPTGAGKCQPGRCDMQRVQRPQSYRLRGCEQQRRGLLSNRLVWL